MRHPPTWPARLHPLVPADTLPPEQGPDLQPLPPGALVADTSRTVDAFQLRADLVSDLLAWSGGDVVISGGLPAVELPDGDLVHLGDYAVRDTPGGDPRAEPAAGFWQRWCPAAPEH